MAHELSVVNGRASMAYAGATPWHGLGQVLTPDAPLETWQHESGLDWEAKLAEVKFERDFIDADGSPNSLITSAPSNRVIYRSDTGVPLSVVSDRYRPVQPKQIIEFYRDLVDRWGFKLETAGALKGGRKIWALANTGEATQLRDRDEVKGYLLLATSFDGSMATQARFTSIRVVCNNTLTLAGSEGRADVTVPHSTEFKADRVKLDLKIGDVWAEFDRNAKSMQNRIVSRDETVRFLLDVYFDLGSKDEIKAFQADEKNAKAGEKLMTRLTTALFESPGAHMASARGTLWGVLNAVTYDIDHNKPARSQENRLDSAWFGAGNALKQKAWAKALEMAA
jgi:phage/plasmid-like protein (TIGR03299 family)